MKTFVLVIFAFGLAGCAEKQFNEMSYSELKGVAQKLANTCAKQGLKPGTEEFVACYKQEAIAENTRRQNSIGRGEAVAGTIGAVAGVALIAGSQPGHN